MDVAQQIQEYLDSLPAARAAELRVLHDMALQELGQGKLWFLNGKNTEGKVIANPNVGYGTCMLHYADGSAKEFYKLGLTATKTGLSVYIMDLPDKDFLSRNYASRLSKAKITGYCIAFKSLKDIDIQVLHEAFVEALKIH